MKYFFVFILSGSLLFAVTTNYWQVSGEVGFEKGDFDGVSLSSEGYISLAPQFEEIFSVEESSVLLSLAPSPDGKILYIGDGSQGKIFKYDLTKKQGELWYATTGVYVRAIVASQKEIFAVTAPNGKLYRIDNEQNAEVYWAPEESYLWSLVRAKDGALYAGVGTPGRVYKIAKRADAELLFESQDAYITALAEKDNAFYIGTYNQGIVLKMQNKKPFALYDSDLAQITAIRPSPDGSIFVSAISVDETPGVISIQKTKKAEEENGDEVVVVASQPPSAGKVQSHIYRITSQGEVELFGDFPGMTIYDIAVEDDSSVIVATGEPARLYKLKSRKEKILLGELEAGQISALAVADKTLYLATSNPAKIYRAVDAARPEGTYTSEVKDMKSQVRFGEISWIESLPKGAQLKLYARTGNTSKPDNTWSEWCGPHTDKNGTRLDCPVGRFIQWKAVFSGKDKSETPILKQVSVAALPFNTAPEITYIQIMDPGVIFVAPQAGEDPLEKYLAGDESALAKSQTDKSQGSSGRKLFKRGMRTVQWYSKDADGDKLEYGVYYKKENADGWTLLAKELKDTIYVWDTLSFPDGVYMIKVVATDAPSNAQGSARECERASDFFTVDNTAPDIRVDSADRKNFRFTVRDDGSPLREVQVAFQENQWRALSPIDGVTDGKAEKFEIADISDNIEGVGIKAIDGANNIKTIFVKLAKTKKGN